MRKRYFLFFFLLKSAFSLSIQNQQCPDQAIVKIKSLTNISSSLPKFKVQAEVMTSKKGQLSKDVHFEILKDGPYKVVEGKNYLIELEEGLVCRIQEVMNE
jgi:hypothetical protein